MAENSKIEWTDHTFNPWIGCSKVAPGCTNCYAEALSKRFNRAAWGPHGTRVKTSESYWRQPLKWNRNAEREGVRRRVFCASLADVFEDWDGPIINSNFKTLYREDAEAMDLVPITMNDLRHALFALIDKTPWLDWLLLTKRPENVCPMWPYEAHRTGGTVSTIVYRPNVWLGTSISHQHTADQNVPELLQCRDLCPVLFLSAEPLLGPVCISNWLESSDGFAFDPSNGPIHRDDGGCGINWIIVGGESGHNARPCNIEWIRNLRDQCRAAGVPCFIKQLGARPRAEVTGRDGLDWPEGTMLSGEDCVPINEFTALATFSLRDKKGGDWAEWPRNLRVRDFPEP